MFRVIIFIIFMVLAISAVAVFADGVDPGASFFVPQFLGSASEGRNACLGLIISENENYLTYDLKNNYAILRVIRPKDSDEDENEKLFEQRKFNKNEAFAFDYVYNSSDDALHNVYFFVIPDRCALKDNSAHDYYLYIDKVPTGDDQIYYIDLEYFDTTTIDDECDENSSNEICVDIDLTPFNDWIEQMNEKFNGANDDDAENDDDSDAEDDDDENDDDQCGCGCHVTGKDASFPLALFMFTVGAIAWLVSRRKTG